MAVFDSLLHDHVDGGLTAHFVDGSLTSIAAWQWVDDAKHERRTRSSRLCQAGSPSILEVFATSLESERLQRGCNACALAASAHPLLRPVWCHVLGATAHGATGSDPELSGTLIVEIVAQAEEAPTGSSCVDLVLAPVVPVRVGRYHYGANCAPSSTLRILERDARTPTAHLSAIGGLSAAAAGHVGQLRALYTTGWSATHAVDKFGSTALMWAASYGSLDVARYLINERCVPVNARNKAGRTALMFACKYAGHSADGHGFVHFLLHEASADVTIRMRDDSTAFDWAVFGGHRPTMELLGAHPKVDLEAINKFGCAAVQWAAASGNVDTLRWLQAKGLSLGHVNAANHGAVVKAAWKGHMDALHWLLIDPEGPRLVWQCGLRDPEGRSVADQAAMNGMQAAAEWLAPLVDAHDPLLQVPAFSLPSDRPSKFKAGAMDAPDPLGRLSEGCAPRGAPRM